jgi:hypothetical protein
VSAAFFCLHNRKHLSGGRFGSVLRLLLLQKQTLWLQVVLNGKLKHSLHTLIFTPNMADIINK